MAKTKLDRKKGSEEEVKVKAKGKQESKKKKDEKYVEEKVPVRLLEIIQNQNCP